MKRLEEMISWYENDAKNMYNDMIITDLEMMNNLYERVAGFEGKMIMDRMINAFCTILDIEHEKISKFNQNTNANEVYEPKMEDFNNDEELHTAFAYSLSKNEKSQLSSYTINDYCSRIKKSWASYYEDYTTGKYPPPGYKGPEIVLKNVSENNILLNAYHNIQDLTDYTEHQVNADRSDRNWSNARAAVKKLAKFRVDTNTSENFRFIETVASGKRDRSTYLFANEEYGKSRLVLAVVRRYAEAKKVYDYASLQKVFGDDIQGSLGVVRKIEDISDSYKGIGTKSPKRYFLDQDETIKLPSGEEVAVCTQWGLNNIEKFIEYANTHLGCEITKLENLI
jgi:hypothetical protein